MRKAKKTDEWSILTAIDPQEKLVGNSQSFRFVKKTAACVAKRRSTVLILGETGTGKQMLTRYIHELSERSDEPFVPVDCLALT